MPGGGKSGRGGPATAASVARACAGQGRSSGSATGAPQVALPGPERPGRTRGWRAPRKRDGPRTPSARNGRSSCGSCSGRMTM
eukprot:15334035-Alexandrium_andersonii.AAC.1